VIFGTTIAFHGSGERAMSKLFYRYSHYHYAKAKAFEKTHSRPIDPPRFLTLFLLAFLFMWIFLQNWGCALSAPNGNSNNGTSGNSISSLAIGSAQILNFSAGQAILEFQDGDPNQRYILALSGGLSGTSLNIQAYTGQNSLGSNFSNPPGAPSGGNPPNAAEENNVSGFNPNPHHWFRMQEWEMTGELSYIPYENSFTEMASPLALGAAETFKVLTDTDGSFKTITANLIGSGTCLKVYLDTAAPALITAQEEVDLADNLNKICKEMETLFGEPSSDIDQSGGLIALLTHELGNFGNNNPLSGYFWAGDLESALSQPASNEKEIIFLIAPQNNSFYGGTVPVTDVLNRILPGILGHEITHLYNYLSRSTPDDPTVNESLSHAIENYLGYPHELRFKQRECLENLSSVDLGSGSMGLDVRGCGSLLVQLFCELFGNEAECFSKLIQSSQTGWQNLAQLAGGDLGEPLAKLLAALVLTGSNLNSTSPYQFKPLGEGPAGDITGFSPFAAYNDYRDTSLHGPLVKKGTLQLPYKSNNSGFAELVEVMGDTSLLIQVSGSSSDGLFAHGASGVLIRMPELGFEVIQPGANEGGETTTRTEPTEKGT